MIVYTTPVCPKCSMLKELLEQHNISFTESYDHAVPAAKGFTQAPVVQDGDDFYDFATAWEKFK